MTVDAESESKIGTSQVQLTLKSSKKKTKSNSSVALLPSKRKTFFDDDEKQQKHDSETEGSREPLVIPLIQNTFGSSKAPTQVEQQAGSSSSLEDDDDKKAGDQDVNKHNSNPAPSLDAEDEAAARALEEEAAMGSSSFSKLKRSAVIIPTAATAASSTADIAERDRYQADLEVLPEQVDVESETYQRVRVEDFGAALLRGMGWKDEEDQTNKSKPDKDSSKDVVVMRRPHRLGLGATPKMLDSKDDDQQNSKRRSRRPDEFRRDKALQEQREEFERQRQAQSALDKQRTLQNGSWVWVRVPSSSSSSTRRRAKILQLVGVPGLNNVSIQYEAETRATIVKRGNIGELLTRQEMDGKPLQDLPLDTLTTATASKTSEPDFDRSRRETSRDDRNSNERRDRDRKRERDRDRKRDREGDEKDKSSRKRHREEKTGHDSASRQRHEKSSASSAKQREEKTSIHWLLTNIRVRVVTEKLGRRYFKQKGVVVDVTPRGATLQLTLSDSSSSRDENSSTQVLDRVPERYLETALPKPGGHVIVLTGPHKWAKGRLLERDSSRSVGVIQVYEDQNVLTLPLDDLAEWCGPLDEDEGIE